MELLTKIASKARSWSLPNWILGLGIFLLGSLTAAPLGQLGNQFLDKFQKEAGPTVIICSPLQVARAIVRQKSKIIFDNDIGAPNSTYVAFATGEKELKNFQLYIYPISERTKDPILYQTEVLSSDLMGVKDTVVRLEQSAVRISAPVLRSYEMIHVSSVFAEPIHYVVEVSADGYSDEFHGLPGCFNAPDRIQSSPVSSVFSFEKDPCKEGPREIGELCVSIPQMNFPFTIEKAGDENDITIEEIIFMNGKRMGSGFGTRAPKAP